MNESEYKAQVAVGTIDYLQVAQQTIFKKVLARIIEDVSIGTSKGINTWCAVALNPRTDIRTLTRMIIDRDIPDDIVVLCACHPSITIPILNKWLERETISEIVGVRKRLWCLQAAAGVLEGNRIDIAVFPSPSVLPPPYTPYPSVPTVTWYSNEHFNLLSGSVVKDINYVDIKQSTCCTPVPKIDADPGDVIEPIIYKYSLDNVNYDNDIFDIITSDFSQFMEH